jgi:pimeloyl-ACP methyl ester carboxylesterase
MPYFESHDGARLYVADWGNATADNEPTAVFVSSAMLSSAMWQYQMVRLVERGVRCVAYDRRGHGRSDDPGRGYDYDSLADDLAALLAQLDLHDVTLISHSMGSGEIVRYLSRHGSQRVTRIVLVSPTTPFVQRTADNPDGVDPRAIEAVRSAMRTDFPNWLVTNAPPFIGEGLPGCAASPALVQWIIADMQRASLEAVLDTNRSMAETDFRAEMRAISVPTLVIHGDHDVSCPIDLTGRRSAALAPNSRLEVYENAAHGLVFTHQERLAADLLAFVQSEAA